MKQRLPLLLILFIGVATPLASTALFFFWRPATQVNIGEVLPPQPLPSAAWRSAEGEVFSPHQWRGDWVLLIAANGECDADCRRRLCQMRQLRLMLPGNYLRLRRAWLITDDMPPPSAVAQETDCGEVDNPALQVKAEDVLDGVEVLYADKNTLPAATAQPFLYLVDPAGVWAMRFAPTLTTYEIHKDMRRLLKISKGRKQIK